MILRVRNSISLKISLLVMAGTSIVFAIVLAYSYNYSRNLILIDAERSAKNLTLAVVRRIEQEFRAVEKGPTYLAGFLESTSCDKGTLETLLKRIVEDSPEIYGSAVAFEARAFDSKVLYYAPYCCRDPNGLKLMDLAASGYDYLRHDWYHVPKELGKPAWSEPYFDEGGADVLMATYSHPLFERMSSGSRERIKGVISADISLEWLTDLIASINVAKTGYCFLISGTGRFVSHPNQEFIMNESIFSIAEERNRPLLRSVGRAMMRFGSGFEDAKDCLTGKDCFVAYAKIPATGWSLGAVFPREELFADLSALHQKIIILSVVGITLLMVVSLFVGQSIAKPLRIMAQATEKVAAGHLDVDLSKIRRTDEVGILAEGFTRMTRGLQERDFIRDTFGRYLTKEVATRLLESKDGLRLGGEEREISILMSDLRGFTALTSHMPPEQVIAFLNRYLGKMVEILMDYRGIIDEIMGDGILAFFGAPEPLDDHPARAVACALKMQSAMEEISRQNEAEGLPHLEMGAAVNTGRVVVGNIGSEKRTKYGAVGSEVNFTGRVESFTVGGQVLISSATYDKLADILEIGQIIPVRMKGMAEQVELYDVKGIRGGYDVQLPKRGETLTPLVNALRAKIYPILGKTVSETIIMADVIKASSTSAIIVPEQPIAQWDNLKLELMEGSSELPEEIYAKAVSVSGNEVLIRFTSVSAEAYKVFRRVATSE